MEGFVSAIIIKSLTFLFLLILPFNIVIRVKKLKKYYLHANISIVIFSIVTLFFVSMMFKIYYKSSFKDSDIVGEYELSIEKSDTNLILNTYDSIKVQFYNNNQFYICCIFLKKTVVLRASRL